MYEKGKERKKLGARASAHAKHKNVVQHRALQTLSRLMDNKHQLDIPICWTRNFNPQHIGKGDGLKSSRNVTWGQSFEGHGHYFNIYYRGLCFSK